MPKIDIPIPQVQQRASQAGAIDPLAGGSSERLKGLTAQMQQALETISKMRDFREESVASIEVSRGLAEIQQQAAVDDIDNFHKYGDRVDALVSEKTNGLSSPLLRAKAAQKFSTLGLSTKNKMLDDYNKKVVRESYGLFVTRFFELEKQFSVSSADERDELFAQAEILIGEAFDDGLITKEKLFEFKGNYKRKWQKSWANNYIETQLQGDDPESASDRSVFDSLDALSEKDKSDLVEKAGKRIEASKKAAEDKKLRGLIQNEFDLTMQMVDGKIGLLIENDIIDLLNAGEISPDFAEAFLAVVNDPSMKNDEGKDIDASDLSNAGTLKEVLDLATLSGRQDSNKDFKALVDTVFSANSKEAIKNVVVDVLNQKRNSNIDKDQLKYLLKAANNRMLGLRALRTGVEAVNKTLIAPKIENINLMKDAAMQLYDGAKNAIDRYLNSSPGANANRVYSEFLRQTQDDPSKAQEAAAQAIDMDKALSNPLYLEYRDKEFYPTPFGPKPIKGFDVDGTPLVEM